MAKITYLTIGLVCIHISAFFSLASNLRNLFSRRELKWPELASFPQNVYKTNIPSSRSQTTVIRNQDLEMLHTNNSTETSRYSNIIIKLKHIIILPYEIPSVQCINSDPKTLNIFLVFHFFSLLIVLLKNHELFRGSQFNICS